MKIKRVQIIRPEIEVEIIKPILGRLYLVMMFPLLIKIKAFDYRFTRKLYNGMAGIVWRKKCYIVAIPKIILKGSATHE